MNLFIRWEPTMISATKMKIVSGSTQKESHARKTEQWWDTKKDMTYVKTFKRFVLLPIQKYWPFKNSWNAMGEKQTLALSNISFRNYKKGKTIRKLHKKFWLFYLTFLQGDKRQWSTCTVEDIGRLVQDNPNCLKEFDPKNPPPALAQIPLTENECDLRKAKGDLVGYVQLKLNSNKMFFKSIFNQEWEISYLGR